MLANTGAQWIAKPKMKEETLRVRMLSLSWAEFSGASLPALASIQPAMPRQANRAVLQGQQGEVRRLAQVGDQLAPGGGVVAGFAAQGDAEVLQGGRVCQQGVHAGGQLIVGCGVNGKPPGRDGWKILYVNTVFLVKACVTIGRWVSDGCETGRLWDGVFSGWRRLPGSSGQGSHGVVGWSVAIVLKMER